MSATNIPSCDMASADVKKILQYGLNDLWINKIHIYSPLDSKWINLMHNGDIAFSFRIHVPFPKLRNGFR
jgi:aspartate carbamoyltransferase regulatory subunit